MRTVNVMYPFDGDMMLQPLLALFFLVLDLPSASFITHPRVDRGGSRG
jgi:hypothetical protein